MRLNGRREILLYLGRSGVNRRGWRKVRQDYAAVLYFLPTRRVWTTSEEVDALDRTRSLTVETVLGP